MQETFNIPRYYTKKEVAELLHVSYSTVRRWTRESELPLPVRSIGGREVIFQRDLETWFENLPQVNTE